MKLAKSFKQLLDLSAITLICLFFLLLSTASFRFDIESEIFPALEIMVIFYLSLYYGLSYWQIFVVGIFFDQIYASPLGTNSLIFLLATLALKQLSRFVLVKEEITNCFVFFVYALCILFLKVVVMRTKGIVGLNLFAIFFQYLTTVFSYPLVKLVLDRVNYARAE